MEERALFLLEGYYKGYKKIETEQSRIVAVLNPSTGIFKGIEVLSSNCDIEDYDELFHYICKCYESPENVSLVVGYYSGELLQYQILLPNQNIGFGNFELLENKIRFQGRERMFQQCSLVRNLKRPVNRYDAMVVTQQFVNLQGKAEFVMDIMKNFSDLYDVVEALLLKRKDDRVWKGLQISTENMAPKLYEKTYMLIPSKYNITL